MVSNDIERLHQQAIRSTAVAKLQTAARELIGGALIFLARHGDEVIEIHPSGSDADLPEFCRLYRSSPDGLDCCTSCRSLMTFGVCYRGTLEYSCHGGVRILATPVPRQVDADEQLVIASCAFARPEREEGWLEFRDHARGLGIDLRKLRAAYDRMPVLTDDKRRVAFSLIEIAASLMNDLLGPMNDKSPDSPPADLQPEIEDIDQLMASALYVSRAQSARREQSPRGSLLVDRVEDMISHHPSMPFTLKNVAKAAHVSPNHLSTVFHQFAGMTFSEFLHGQRIALAKRLLRDLSLNIEEVAKRTGFPNASYFSRRFRLHTGSTPSDWRRQV
jgi:AraC-like DNA-binding protein